MTNQRPLRGSEEGMNLDVGCSSAGTQSAILILDKQFANQRFAKTGVALASGTA